jgi:hypothetical protein
VKRQVTFTKIVMTLALLSAIPAPAGAEEAQPAEAQPTESKPAAAEASPNPPPTATKGKAKAGVLDFEAELIEGERKSPDLFLQLQSGTPNLDAILFQRTNFNDFHNIEKHRRPLYRRYVK